MHLTWNKCVGDVWCSLLNLNLDHSHFHNLAGVYIIWHSGENPWTVYVGQGNISTRLLEHRNNDDILKYSHHGLFVSWARVDAHLRNGIERYLAENLRPKVGHLHPTTTPPIQVNVPW